MKTIPISIITAMLMYGCSFAQQAPDQKKEIKNMENTNSGKPAVYDRSSTEKVKITNEDWKKMLSPEVYTVARQKGTERPWSSKFEDFKEKGTYYCAACGNALFVSDTKFDSGCGWPSFYETISKNSIISKADYSHGMKRTEVMCGRCEAHLGHVFEDGPPPTGLRYCINGVILDFEKAAEAEKKYQKNK
jgi:peptide-methionine (R)-S-oxide reductase